MTWSERTGRTECVTITRMNKNLTGAEMKWMKSYLQGHRWSSQAWRLTSQRTRHGSRPAEEKSFSHPKPIKYLNAPNWYIKWDIHWTPLDRRMNKYDKDFHTSFSLSVRTLISSSYLSSFCEYCRHHKEDRCQTHKPQHYISTLLNNTWAFRYRT